MNPRGFTLIELLIVIAIISILVAIAHPDFGPMLDAHRTRAVANELYTDIYWAKEEAIKRGQSVTVRFTPDGWQIVIPDGSAIKSYVLPYQQIIVNGGSGFAFDGVRGLTNADSITVSSRSGTVALNVVALGYADICSSDITGFQKC